ncbi:MAG TPA: hypothetical protein QF861_14895 [Alphaproteobacteria bacterium]|jgi:Asp-tRNA(Asn)/Glu-tRNA(Gln) amidotransferase C subunit|nr:hypothetical protein [Alphaproteobacteria bacterium]HJP22837.1 hypothetical protein [Alphaproteobacteria bacterium]
MPTPEQIAALARDFWGLEVSEATAQRLAGELERLANQANQVRAADFDIEPGSDFARRLARTDPAS